MLIMWMKTKWFVIKLQIIAHGHNDEWKKKTNIWVTIFISFALKQFAVGRSRKPTEQHVFAHFELAQLCIDSNRSWICCQSTGLAELSTSQNPHETQIQISSKKQKHLQFKNFILATIFVKKCLLKCLTMLKNKSLHKMNDSKVSKSHTCTSYLSLAPINTILSLKWFVISRNEWNESKLRIDMESWGMRYYWKYRLFLHMPIRSLGSQWMLAACMQHRHTVWTKEYTIVCVHYRFGRKRFPTMLRLLPVSILTSLQRVTFRIRCSQYRWKLFLLSCFVCAVFGSALRIYDTFPSQRKALHSEK